MPTASEKQHSGLDRIYSVLGEDCIYTPQGGAPVQVRATVTYDLESFGDQSELQGVRALVSVRRSEVDLEPRSGDRFDIHGQALIVGRIYEADEFEHVSAVS